jgi:uncharacterized repeat protein (TIGR01451 family)
MILALTAILAFVALPARADDGPLAITETPTPTTTNASITETATATPPATATATLPVSATPTAVTATATATTPAEGGSPTPTPTSPVATNTPTSGGDNTPTPVPPGVSIIKRASSDRVAIGDVVEYVMVVTNPNSTPVENVSVRDALPAQVDYVSASAPVGNVTYDAGSRAVIFTLGTLAGNQQVTISVRARVNAAAPVPSSLLNQAVLTSGSGSISTQSNLTIVEVVPGQLPNTGQGPGPREIVTLAVAAAIACLGGLALVRRVREARAVVHVDDRPQE